MSGHSGCGPFPLALFHVLAQRTIKKRTYPRAKQAVQITHTHTHTHTHSGKREAKLTKGAGLRGRNVNIIFDWITNSESQHKRVKKNPSAYKCSPMIEWRCKYFFLSSYSLQAFIKSCTNSNELEVKFTVTIADVNKAKKNSDRSWERTSYLQHWRWRAHHAECERKLDPATFDFQHFLKHHMT